MAMCVVKAVNSADGTSASPTQPSLSRQAGAAASSLLDSLAPARRHRVAHHWTGGDNKSRPRWRAAATGSRWSRAAKAASNRTRARARTDRRAVRSGCRDCWRRTGNRDCARRDGPYARTRPAAAARWPTTAKNGRPTATVKRPNCQIEGSPAGGSRQPDGRPIGREMMARAAKPRCTKPALAIGTWRLMRCA